MTRTTSRLIAAAAALAWTASACAQTSAPEVPNPAHPFPDNPVATDGTSLRSIWPAGGTGPRQAAGARPFDESTLQALSLRAFRRAR